jgi:peptide/nickel transport system substrate-binding protein
MPSIFKRCPLIAVAAALTGALAITACGGSTTPGPSAGVARSSVLTIANDTGGPYGTTLNPFSADSALQSISNLWPFVYEGLLQFNDAKPGQITPWLAKGYKWSDGNKTVTFTIRPGVKWSDGRPFTSADVVFTFNLLHKYPALNLNGVNFKTVQALGPHVVRMTFAAANLPGLYYVGTQWIVPAHIWSKITDPAHYVDSNPVGTGPYLVKSVTPSNLAFVRNNNYWGGRPAVAQVEAPADYTNAAADVALEQGSAQWGDAYIAGLKRYTSTGNGTHQYSNTPIADVGLVPNVAKYPLNSLPLRQAISDALNRQAFASTADQNEEPAVTNPTGLILPRDADLLAPQYKNAKFRMSDSAARATLKAAGFTYKGSHLYTPTGKAVDLPILVNAAFSDWVQGVPTLVNALRAIGIQSTEDTESFTQTETDLSTGNFMLGLTYQASGPSSYYNYDQFLSSANTAPLGKPATTNYGRWTDPETDQALAQYARASTPAAQKSAMAAIERVMVEKVPFFPLEYQVEWGQYETGDFSGWPQGTNSYAIASSYDAPMNELVLLHLKPKK